MCAEEGCCSETCGSLNESTFGNWQDNDLQAMAAGGIRGQQHMYGRGGDDYLELKFGASALSFWQGHHVRGDDDSASRRGKDIFDFTGLANIAAGAVVVGRIEDFDYSRDKIQIEGRNVNLHDLPGNARIVEYDGAHNDPDSAPQQWLLITTAKGGTVFYALEGARADMTGDGGSNYGNSETHFLKRGDLPDFSTLRDVAFFDQKNYVPDGFSPQGGVIINDDDFDSGSYHEGDGSLISLRQIVAITRGTGQGDLIASGLNDDRVQAGGGNDCVWGGSGNDLLHAGGGRDTGSGGSGDDTILGGAGDDKLFGEIGSDKLIGGAGADLLHGGGGFDLAGYAGARSAVVANLSSPDNNRGEAEGDRYAHIEGLIGSRFDDRLSGDAEDNLLLGGDGHDFLTGKAGNDRMFGGDGRDSIVGGSGQDTAIGGVGADSFVFVAGHGTLEVRDYKDDVDQFDLTAFGFASVTEAMSHAHQHDGMVHFHFDDGSELIIQDAHKSELWNDVLIG